MRLMFAFILCCASIMLHAADPLADLRSAMAGDDFSAKRAAIAAVTGMAKDQDEEVLNALIGALGDRQASTVAADALRARTGLSKPRPEARSASSYPGHPPSDSAGDWSAWVAAWKKEQAKDKKLTDLDKKTKQLEKEQKDKEKAEKDKKPDGDAKTDDKPAEAKSRTAEVQAQRGPRCRIHFRNGGSKVYYLIAKRTDADGNLLSVRVAYLNDDGTEVLTADAIARLEEDVR